MTLGRVVRAIGGFFYVEPMEETTQQHIECSVRGRLKKNTETISVGDYVTYEMDEGKGVITGVTGRETLLKRPYIANVNMLALVFALRNPNPNETLITKFLVLAEQSGISYLLIFNKADLVEEEEANQFCQLYRKYGYRVILTSVKTNRGKAELLEILDGKVTAFSGPSGVGKSALLNMIAPGLSLQTGMISQKIGRGKHTTREVQLLKIAPNSYVADTPGFTQIALDGIAPEEVGYFFPDISSWASDCRFHGCLHQAEPGCAVRQAVAEGNLSEQRYQSYLAILAEIILQWKNRYR